MHVGIDLTISLHKVCNISYDGVLWYVSDIALDGCWALHVTLLAAKDVVGYCSG